MLRKTSKRSAHEVLPAGNRPRAGSAFPAAVAVLLAALAPPTVLAASARLPRSVEVGAEDVSRAREAFAQLAGKMPVYPSDGLQSFVSGVGDRIVASAPPINVPFRFAVLDSEGVFAYSYADGQIVISRGMLAHLNSEAELAAVLAHEVGHTLGLHQARNWQQMRRAMDLEAKLGQRFKSDAAREALGTLSLAKVRGYNREQELEADDWGEQLLRRAGYPAGSTARMLRFLVQYDTYVTEQGFELWELPEDSLPGGGVFATHPSPAARLEAAVARERVPPAPSAASPEYLARLRDLDFGISRRYGTRRGQQFVDAARRFTLTLPEGWYIFGNGDELVAAPAENSAILRIQFADAAAVGSPRDSLVADLRERQAGAAPPVETRSAPGLEVAWAELPGADGAAPSLWALVDVRGRRLRCAATGASPDAWAMRKAQVEKLLQGISAVGDAIPVGLPERIAVIQAPAAGPLPDADARPRRALEILNQLYPGGQVVAGQWVKVVR